MLHSSAILHLGFRGLHANNTNIDSVLALILKNSYS